MLGRRAFICYTGADKAVALRLRRALCRYASPSGDDEDAKAPPDRRAARLGPVLWKRLDADPLGATDRFDIETSDWLILICSPAAASSPALDAAAMIFKARARARRIIPVVIAGEPGASRTAGLAHLECLPRALLYAADATGALTSHPVTPEYVDLRADGMSPPDAAAAVASRVTGTPIAAYRRAERRRRRRVGLFAGAAAAAALVALVLAPVLLRDMKALSRAAEARAAVETAHHALDRGRRDVAVRALTSVFPKEFDFAAPPFPVPEEALSALSRAALETRELADLDLQTLDIAQLIALRDGAVIAIAADAGAHLIDLGAGEALQVYRPAGDGHGAGDGASRVSADGETLWTARFGAEAINDDGDVYAPLIFEDVDLASGAISMKTAVQSLPPKGGGAAISPDGALFAVDIGPGHTDRTLVAVFSRARQALAGVATLPADSAQVEFLAPDRLLLTTNPPNIYGAAPGLYLWDLAEDRPRVLRAPGRAPLCPGASGASRRSVAAEIAAGRLPAADWAASETGAEVALLLPSLGGGSCILRWDAATGREVPPVFTRTTYRSLAFAVAGGPYAALPEDGDLTLVSAGAETPLAGCGGAARHFASGGQGLILCEGDRAATLHQGYSGRRSWRGPPLSSLTAAAYDPQGQRLIMARADGRLAVWDAAARGYPVVRGDAPMTLAQPDKDHVAVLIDGGASVVFDLSGDPATEIDPALLARIRPAEQSPLLALAATGPAAPEETCAPLIAANVIHRSDSPSGRRAAIETADGLAVYDRATCLPVMRMATRTAGSGPMLVSDDFLWAPTPGEVMVFPLSVPPAAALASLHSRAAAFRAK